MHLNPNIEQNQLKALHMSQRGPLPLDPDMDPLLGTPPLRL